MRAPRRRRVLPPKGARLVHPDGTVTHLELVYAGQDEEGVHRWDATSRVAPGDKLHVDEMPPKSVLRIRHTL